MHDVIVIGAGPGGYHAALYAAHNGLKTAVVEKGNLGGVCLQEGCIPTKSLAHSAEMLRAVKECGEYGINVSGWELDWDQVQKRKRQVVGQLTTGLEKLMAAHKVEVVRGAGRLAGDGKAVQVKLNEGGEVSLTSENVIIAAGSQPSVPPIPGLDREGVVGSREALELPSVPRRMLIIGGGVIGCEFASLFAAFGSEVTIAEFLPRLLGPVDGEIARRMESQMKRSGIKILTSAKVAAVENSGSSLVARIEKSGNTETVEAEIVLLAAGRQPRLEGLGLDEAGVKTSPAGIEVDSGMRTNVPGIYAIGDITGKYLLAHVASAQGLAAVDNILGRDYAMDYSAVPNVVFTYPEVASAGMTEDEAREAGLDYKVTKFNFSANSRAAIIGATAGIVKLLTLKPEGKILGVHMFGPGCGELLPEVVLAIRKGLTAEDVARSIHAHPTLSEAVMEIAHGVDAPFIHMLGR